MAIGKTLLPIQPPVPKYTVDIFTTSGTYTKPANLDYAYVFMQSSGGGGASGRRGAAGSNRGGGPGNPGGNAVLANFLDSDLSATETVTIGAAGAGGAARTTDNTSGANGIAAGNTSFRNATFFNVLSPVAFGWITTTITTLRGASSNAFISLKTKLVGTFGQTFMIGNFTTDDRARGNCINPYSGHIKTIRDAASVGGQISSANAQIAGGPLGGFYNTSNVITGAMAGTAAETAPLQPSVFMTYGEFLNQIFPWFDTSDANYDIGRNGLGGGCGNTAGTVAGVAGSQGVGYGAGGGGGGASTNGANSGAGAAGTSGIVIIINVLTS